MKPVVRIVSNGEKFKLQERSGFWPFHLWLDLGTGLSFSALRPFRVSYYASLGAAEEARKAYLADRERSARKWREVSR